MFALIAYIFTYFFVMMVKKKNNKKHKHFPPMMMTKNGVVFKSFCRHRLKICDFKFLQIGTNLYIKSASKIVIINNIDKVEKHDDFIYFTGLGKVKILFDCKQFYRYFNIKIISNKFTLTHMKQNAILELLNNGFDINFCKTVKKYIKIIENVLNIHIFEKKIVIQQNKFLLPYTLKYKLNNIIKVVNVNQTLEEN